MSESFLELMPKDWNPVDREACKAEFDVVKQFDKCKCVSPENKGDVVTCNCDVPSMGHSTTLADLILDRHHELMAILPNLMNDLQKETDRNKIHINDLFKDDIELTESTHKDLKCDETTQTTNEDE